MTITGLKQWAPILALLFLLQTPTALRAQMAFDNTITNPYDASAFGQRTQATGPSSTAWGWDTIASGPTSTAFGFGTVASGTNSTAWGVCTTASGFLSTAFGYWSVQATSDMSTAFGIFTLASASCSTAFGYGTTASGFRSTAFGDGTTATGDTATSWGMSASASGTASTLPAWLDITSADNQAANLGQLKTVFNFDLTNSSSGSPLPDWWLIHYYSPLTSVPLAISATAPSLWSPQVTNLDAYQKGLNPIDFYNGQPSTLTIVSGTNQTGPPAGYLPAPLVVMVTDSNGNGMPLPTTAPARLHPPSPRAIVSAT
jgi:hypothetical protein